MAQKNVKKIFELNINKIIFIFVFFASLIVSTIVYSISIDKFSLCDKTNFQHEKNSEGKLLKLDCDIPIKPGGTINIDEIEGGILYAIAHVKSLDTNPNEELRMYWEFKKDPSIKHALKFEDRQTYYSENIAKEVKGYSDKIVEATKKYKEQDGLFRILFSVIDVIIKPSNNFRTFTSKNIDKNFHIGEWEVTVYDKGKVIDEKQKPLVATSFTLTR